MQENRDVRPGRPGQALPLLAGDAIIVAEDKEQCFRFQGAGRFEGEGRQGASQEPFEQLGRDPKQIKELGIRRFQERIAEVATSTQGR